jgi:hypothetical protein
MFQIGDRRMQSADFGRLMRQVCYCPNLGGQSLLISDFMCKAATRKTAAARRLKAAEIFAAHSAKLQCGKIFRDGRKHGRGLLCKTEMGKNFSAAHSANSKWRKTFPRRTLQIQNGGKLFRGVLCKFKMEENFFAAHSANSKWRKTFSRRTLQIQNGGKLFRGGLCKFKMDATRPKWPRTARMTPGRSRNG